MRETMVPFGAGISPQDLIQGTAALSMLLGFLTLNWLTGGRR
jgi:hypothetical protein